MAPYAEIDMCGTLEYSGAVANLPFRSIPSSPPAACLSAAHNAGTQCRRNLTRPRSFRSTKVSKSQRTSQKSTARRWDHRLVVGPKFHRSLDLRYATRCVDEEVISLSSIKANSGPDPLERAPVEDSFIPTSVNTDSELISGIPLSNTAHTTTLKQVLAIDPVVGRRGSIDSADLLRFITEQTEIIYCPPYNDWSVSLAADPASALEVLLRIFCQQGDTIMTDEYVSSSVIKACAATKITVAGIRMDEHGILPDCMDDMLSRWDESLQGKKPFMLHTVPTSQNPTVSTQPLERRKAVYAIAEKHDMIILEEDPLFFLQMQAFELGPTHDTSRLPGSNCTDALLSNTIPSYLTLDTSGRVCRVDSIGQVNPPSSRVSWITASQQIIERFNLAQEPSNRAPSPLATRPLQPFANEALSHQTFLTWLAHVRAENTRRRDIMCHALSTYLPSSSSSFSSSSSSPSNHIIITTCNTPSRSQPISTPTTQWLKLDASHHPQVQQLFTILPEISAKLILLYAGLLSEIEDRIVSRCLRHKVVVDKGSSFQPDILNASISTTWKQKVLEKNISRYAEGILPSACGAGRGREGRVLRRRRCWRNDSGSSCCSGATCSDCGDGGVGAGGNDQGEADVMEGEEGGEDEDEEEEDDDPSTTIYLCLNFASGVSDEDMVEGVKRLGDALREEFKLSG